MTTNTEARCVKCGHRATINGICQVGTGEPHPVTGYKAICGCHCVFPNTRSARNVGSGACANFVSTKGRIGICKNCGVEDYFHGVDAQALQGEQTKNHSVDEGRCKCGASKDDPIHSISTEFQKSHSFDEDKTPLSDRAGNLRAAQGDGVAGEQPDNLYDGAIMLLRSWVACFESPPRDWDQIAANLTADSRALLRHEAARQESAWDTQPTSAEHHTTSDVLCNPERDKSLRPEIDKELK